jgi:hypothetical protein
MGYSLIEIRITSNDYTNNAPSGLIAAFVAITVAGPHRIRTGFPMTQNERLGVCDGLIALSGWLVKEFLCERRARRLDSKKRNVSSDAMGQSFQSQQTKKVFFVWQRWLCNPRRR